MSLDPLGLWVAEPRSDRAERALDLALGVGALRLEFPPGCWTGPLLERARSAGLQALERHQDTVRNLSNDETIPLPRGFHAGPWLPDVFRQSCYTEFQASHPDTEWASGPDRLPPAASVDSHRGDLRMHLAGAWVGGARGIRLSPWPAWTEPDSEADGPPPETAVLAEFRRLRELAGHLATGAFRQEPVLLLEPDEPDAEDLRRIYEAWLLLELAGVHASRVPARLATRKRLNQARLVVVPGCWGFPEERWRTLGGWVRGGGTLYLGFDERALLEGYPPRGDGGAPLGPPGPGFLHKLVGREPIGHPPHPRLADGRLRVRFQRKDEVFHELRELHLHDLPPLPCWPLEEPLSGKRNQLPRRHPVEVVALGPGQSVALWRHRLLKGEVLASALPLEAILSRRSGGFGDGVVHGGLGERPMGPEVSRFFFCLARAAGVVTGKVPLEPFTSVAIARGRGGFPHGLVVVNRRSRRCPGRLRMEVQGGFQARDLELDKPVALMKGQLVCPVDPWDYRVVGLSRS